jgi:hypothetical protein
MAKLKSALLFVSDLHLGPSLREETEILPLDWASWIRLFGMLDDLDVFFTRHCASHNKAIVKALPRYLRSVLDKMQRHQGYARDTFDQCVFLGDLVTWPNPDAFSFFNEYVTRDRWVPAEGHSPIAGLDFKHDEQHRQVTVIPGNHDKLLRQNLSLFDVHVRKPLDLETIAPQGATIIRRRVAHNDFAFLAIDASNYTRAPELRVDRSARRHLAAGHVSDELLDQVTKLAAELKGTPGIRVLLIHYPVDFSTASTLGGALCNRLFPHDVKDIEKLLAAIPAGAIDFAAHGHLHNPGIYSHGGMSVLSVGTTFQLNSPVNDFYVVTVSETDQIRAEHHVWTKTGFRKDPVLSKRLN